jgi:hypothetical protein
MCARLPAALRVDAHGVSLLVEHGEFLRVWLGRMCPGCTSLRMFELDSGNLASPSRLVLDLQRSGHAQGGSGAGEQRVGKWAGWLA